MSLEPFTKRNTWPSRAPRSMRMPPRSHQAAKSCTTSPMSAPNSMRCTGSNTSASLCRLTSSHIA